MYCKYCGKQIPNGTSVCIYCGIRLNAASQPAPVVETPIPAAPVSQPAAAPMPTPVPVQQPVQQPQYTPYQPQYAPQQPAQPQPPKKKSGGKTALIIILVLLLLGGLAVGGYFLYNEVIVPFLEDDGTSEEERENRDDEEIDDEYDPLDDRNEDVQQGGEHTTRPVNPDSGNEDYPGTTDTPDYLVTEPIGTEPAATYPPVYNPYEAYINSSESYILPNSNSSYLCYNDVMNLSLDALILAEQEIHARHGQIAPDSYMQEYFDSRSWYTSSGRNYQLNDYEKANLQLIAIHQKMRRNQHYNSGNPYISLHLEAGEYVVPGSNSRYLHQTDAMNLSAAALYVARNEIYARRGMIFSDAQLQEYFYTKSWYTPSTTIIYDSNLNQYETNNLVFLDAYSRKINRVPVGSNTEYYDEYLAYGNRDYFFSDSSYRYMSEYELYGMDADELELARNEIYARHGYTFSDQALREYFCTKSWYCPNTAVGDQSALKFSSVELANIELMRNYESRVEYGEYQ